MSQPPMCEVRWVTLPPPTLVHVCDLTIEAGEVRTLGSVRHGMRRIIPIDGGTVSGPRIKGRIAGPGADWQTILSDDVADLDARYQIETDDGALIELVDRGVRRGPPDVLRRLAAGDAVEPADYYMRGAIRMETGDDRYRWVNGTLFVGTGARRPSGVVISVYEIT